MVVSRCNLFLNFFEFCSILEGDFAKRKKCGFSRFFNFQSCISNKICMKTNALVSKNVDILAYFKIWDLFQIAQHINFRFWNSLIQLFDEDYLGEIEVRVVFVKPKVVSNFCLTVFLKPKVVSRIISALWVVFFFFRNVSSAKNSCFLAKIHHKQGFRVLLHIIFQLWNQNAPAFIYFREW